MKRALYGAVILASSGAAGAQAAMLVASDSAHPGVRRSATVVLLILLVTTVGSTLWATRSLGKRRLAFLAISAAVIPFVLMFLVVHGQLGAVDRGRQARTLNDMRYVAGEIERYRIKHGQFPALGEGEASNLLPEEWHTPLHDGWGSEYRISFEEDGYEIVSFGAQCQRDEIGPEGYPRGRTRHFEADIVLRDGSFVQYPEGSRP